jgi:ABC-2 type transport system permease protein
MIAVFKRELRNYFQTPIGWIFMGLFLLISGFFFTYGNILSGSSYFTGFLGGVQFIYLFAIPLLTMRLVSEEKRQRTDQLLMTAPISTTEIVLGKYLAAFGVFLITLLVTVSYAMVIGLLGDLAVWETVASYVGFIFMGACYIVVGLFVSASTENQITSALVSFFALLFIWLVDAVGQAVPADPLSGALFAAFLALGLALYLYLSARNIPVAAAVAVLGLGAVVAVYFLNQGAFSGFIRSVLQWFSVNKRYESFSMGILKVESLVYYASFTAFFLFLTVRMLEKRRWN